MNSFYQVGGSLDADAPSYIMRKADDNLYEALNQGQFAYVLNSRQMGKSSLWIRTQKLLTDKAVKCATVDLTKLGKSQSEDDWYRILFYELIKSFNLSIQNQRQTWWNERTDVSPINRFNEFIEEVLLQEISENMVICLDEIDHVLSFNFSTDAFFAWIRSCYNQRSFKPIYRRLTFCMLGVATVSSFIRDNTRTPFNIGQKISLSGFNKREAQPLAEGLTGKVPNPKQLLEEVLEWTGGQPFLTQKICNLIFTSRSELKNPSSENEIDVRDFVRSRIINNWESQDYPPHLSSIRDRLLNNPSTGKRMLKLYQKILQEGEVVYDANLDQIQLRLTGLVVEHNQNLKVYNKIYRNVFNETWVERELNKIAPYIEQYEAWSNSAEDSSKLLSDQNLQEALNWAQEKSLSESENRFLKLSQIEEQQKAQKSQQKEAYKIARILLASKFPDEQQKKLIDGILLWTGNQLNLTEIVCSLVINHQELLGQGAEKEYLEKIIEEHIIENWERKDAAEHLITMQNRLLAIDGDVKSRLETYKEILQGRVIYGDQTEKIALLEAELVINNDEDWLEVANRIYKEVFNLQWVNQELKNIDFVNNQSAPLTTKSSLTILLVFIGLTIVWLSLKLKETPPKNVFPEICTQRDLTISLKENIQKLQNLQNFQNQRNEDFPSECKTQLDELSLINKAIGLAINNRVANKKNQEDALEVLCKIPENSINFNEAKEWVKRWYNNNYWQPDIKQALNNNPECEKLIQ